MNPSTHSPAVADGQRRQMWLPSLSQFIWLVFFLGIFLTDWRLAVINADGDPCLHGRIGQWMIEHRAIIRTDVFSHTRAGAPLITKEWLSELLFAALGDALGWNGIVLLTALLIATCLWLLHRQLLLEGTEPLLATALTMSAALACSVHWLARPHLFTHLLAVVFAWHLRWFDLGRLPGRSLFLRLVPLMILWVNLHGAFFTGLVIIATFLMGNGIGLLVCAHPKRSELRARLGTLALLAVVCSLATFVNPNGWKLPAHVFEFFRDPTLAHYTNEFRSPSFHSQGTRGYLVELAWIAATLIILRPRLSPADVVIIGTWGFLSLFAARNVPLFALLVTPVLAEHWQAALQTAGANRVLDRYRRLSARIARFNHATDGRIIVALVLIAAIGVAAKPRLAGGAALVTTEVMSNRFPVATVSFLAAHPHAVHGEMFNDYGWGGYLMFALPDRKVFIDGRNDFYGPGLVLEFDQVSQVRPGWDDVLQKYNVGWTVLPRFRALNSVLALDPNWALVHTDEVATVYGRVDKLTTARNLSGPGRD
jgi:hypothetical protein